MTLLTFTLIYLAVCFVCYIIVLIIIKHAPVAHETNRGLKIGSKKQCK